MCLVCAQGTGFNFQDQNKQTKNLDVELLCDLAILLLTIYSKELEAGTRTGICTTTLMAALFHKSQKIESTMSINR